MSDDRLTKTATLPRPDYGESDIRAWMYDKERTWWPPHLDSVSNEQPSDPDLIRSLRTALFRLACTRRKLHYALLSVPVPVPVPFAIEPEAASLPPTTTPSTSE